MVFFTSVFIVSILYYLQADGLIYVTIIAVLAELINIFMTHTLTKSVEKKAANKFEKIAEAYKTKIAAQKRTIKQLEAIQEESIQKIYKANLKIKEYEEKLKPDESEILKPDEVPEQESPSQKKSVLIKGKEEPKEFIDLPSGSNRKKLPF